MRKRLTRIGVFNGLLVLALYVLWDSINPDSPALVAFSVVAVGLTTLFGILSVDEKNTKVSTRFAIAVTVLVVWFAAIGALMFTATDDKTLADEAFDSITLAVSVVIVFYFGAQAYEAAAGKKAQGGSGRTIEETVEVPKADGTKEEVTIVEYWD